MARQLRDLFRRVFLLLALASTIYGCSSLSYLQQAGVGQLRVFSRSKPISKVLLDPKVDPEVKELLAQVSMIKLFAEKSGLKKTHNYEEYVDWGRPEFIHLLIASRPDRFEAKTWEFPLVGSFNYLGFFQRSDADVLRVQLESEGYETELRTADAYSSLGWFQDPILSTMLPPSRKEIGELVHLILHESVHATFLIPNQTSFNEQLAEFVAGQLTPRYLSGLTEGESFTKNYQSSRASQSQRLSLMLAAYEELDALYAIWSGSEREKQKRDEIFKRLKRDLKSKRSFNNATLIHVKTYSPAEREFLALWTDCNGDLEAFLRVIRQLKEESFPGPQTSKIGAVIEGLRNSADRHPQGTSSHE